MLPELIKNPLIGDIAIKKNEKDFLKTSTAKKTELKHLARVDAANNAISSFKKGIDLYLLGRGKFSVIELILALVEKTGPAYLDLSTWTVGPKEITELEKLKNDGAAINIRWLMDVSMHRRESPRYAKIIEVFGKKNVKVCMNHAKIYLIGNEKYSVSLLSSANFNMNPRYEWYWIRENKEFYDFNCSFFDEFFK